MISLLSIMYESHWCPSPWSCHKCKCSSAPAFPISSCAHPARCAHVPLCGVLVSTLPATSSQWLSSWLLSQDQQKLNSSLHHLITMTSNKSPTPLHLLMQKWHFPLSQRGRSTTLSQGGHTHRTFITEYAYNCSFYNQLLTTSLPLLLLLRL